MDNQTKYIFTERRAHQKKFLARERITIMEYDHGIWTAPSSNVDYNDTPTPLQERLPEYCTSTRIYCFKDNKLSPQQK
jgi:hypothetical protein